MMPVIHPIDERLPDYLMGAQRYLVVYRDTWCPTCLAAGGQKCVFTGGVHRTPIKSPMVHIARVIRYVEAVASDLDTWAEVSLWPFDFGLDPCFQLRMGEPWEP